MAYKQIRGNEKIGQPKSARLKAHGLRARAWWVIRRLKVFTKLELLCTVATSDEKTASSNIGRYLYALTRAKILTVDEKRKPGNAPSSNGFIRYRLVLDLGHEPPVWRVAADEVYDPNSGRTFSCNGGEHA